ncbi:hypothetical protein niasHT_036122 [Heterodera trifolii]|uniref:Lon proteolytic domain-containing protein n=1 Tax=Heterodera trifolii TaxID=157864 RepID=A0ABD2I8I4_9BILA
MSMPSLLPLTFSATDQIVSVFGLDKLGTLRPHICKAHREDHHQGNRKPNAPGLVIGLTIVPPTGGIAIWHFQQKTALFSYFSGRAPALKVRFAVSPVSRASYDTALARAQQLLCNEIIPPLAVRRWPKRHTPVVGPSGGAAFFCAVMSLMTNRLCRSDTAVSATVTNGVGIGAVGGLRWKAEGARSAGLTRMVMATANEAHWAAIPAASKQGLTPVSSTTCMD